MSGARRPPACWAAFPVSAFYTERSPLGCHRKHSRNRVSRRLPNAAVPAVAVAGVAAAFCLSPQALAEPVTATATTATTAITQGTTHHSVTLDAATRLGHAPGQLLSATKQAQQKSSNG